MASNPTSREVYNYLRDKGLNNNQAQGILANIIGESGLDIDAEGDPNAGGSIGLFQYNFNAGRAQPFVTAVPDWRTNWRGQIDYVIDKDPLTKIYLNKAFNSPESAAADFMRNWEIPDSRVWASRDKKHNDFIRNNNFNSEYQSGSSTSDSSQQDENTLPLIDEAVDFNPNLFEVSDVICKDCQKDPIAQSITSGQTIIQADPCKDNTLAKVEAYLTNFFDRVTQVGNAVINLPNEINFVVDLIGSTITGFTNKMLGSLSDALSEVINKGIDALTALLRGLGRTDPEIIVIQFPLIGLVKNLFDALFCAAAKVVEGARDVMKDLINASIKNVLNAGQCVVEQIMGSFTNNLVNIVDSIAGPLLAPIINILNGFGVNIFNFNIKDFLLTGINAIRKIANLFECDDKKSCPASSKYVIDKGLFKDMDEDDENSSWNRIFSGTAISQNALNLVGDFEEKYGKWSIFGAPLSEASNLDPCNFGNVTECGLPTVSFFGGDGLGAAGSVILGGIIDNVDTEDAVGSVAKVGSIVGVEMTNPGEGYTREPIVTFQDSCNKGYGAYGRAIIEDGQVTGVSMFSEGENYPAGIGELPLFIVDVIIENPGENYADDDIIQIPGTDAIEDDFEVTIVDGRITDVSIISALSFNGLPNLNIRSASGFGAVLRPIMSTEQPTIPGTQELIDVIDCIDTQLVGFVNGAPYYGPFHEHVKEDGTVIKMVGRNHINAPHSIIYETRKESLKNINITGSTSQMSSITNQVTSVQSTSTGTSGQTTNTTFTLTPPTSSSPEPEPTPSPVPAPAPAPSPAPSPAPAPSPPPSGGGYGGY